MQNDTEIFYAMRFNIVSGQHEWTGKTGKREAIVRDGLTIELPSVGYCPHEWIDGNGYVDPALARQG